MSENEATMIATNVGTIYFPFVVQVRQDTTAI